MHSLINWCVTLWPAEAKTPSKKGKKAKAPKTPTTPSQGKLLLLTLTQPQVSIHWELLGKCLVTSNCCSLLADYWKIWDFSFPSKFLAWWPNAEELFTHKSRAKFSSRALQIWSNARVRPISPTTCLLATRNWYPRFPLILSPCKWLCFAWKTRELHRHSLESRHTNHALLLFSFFLFFFLFFSPALFTFFFFS